MAEVPLGSPLGQSLYNDRGDVLAAQGVRLDAPLLAAIRARGYNEVFVDDPLTQGIDIADPLSPETRAKAAKSTRDTMTVGEQAATAIMSGGQITANSLPRTNDIRRMIKEAVPADDVIAASHSVVEEVLDAPTLLGLNSIKAQDSFAFSHAIEVAAVAVAIGRRIHLKPNELRRLSRGAMLHDIGQTFTGDTTDGRTGALTPADVEQLNRHTRLGYDFLQNVPDFDSMSNHVAYQHHEWQSGGGYPRGLKGIESIDPDGQSGPGHILLIAQLTSVADVYDALCSERPFRPRVPREMAMSLIRRMGGVKLNPDLVRAFLEVMPIFPTGYPVRIVGGSLDRWQGVVAKLGNPNINRPVVRLFKKPDGSEVDPFEVDLAQDAVARLMSVPVK